MKPLFTIHGGEFLVGSHIQRKFRRVNLWLPAKDSGVDLLVTDSQVLNAVSLQVKFSRDFLVTDMAAVFQKPLRACGWYTIKLNKLRKSAADLWVFVLLGFERRTRDFIIVPRRQLWRRFQSIHGSPKTIQCYLWVTARNGCWEARGLRRKDQVQIANGGFRERHRDFTKWLNNWGPIEKLNR